MKATLPTNNSGKTLRVAGRPATVSQEALLPAACCSGPVAPAHQVTPAAQRQEVTVLIRAEADGARATLEPYLERTATHRDLCTPAWVYLLCFPELLDDLGRHLVVLQEVVGDGVADPGGPLGRPQLQELVPRLLWPEKKERERRILLIHGFDTGLLLQIKARRQPKTSLVAAPPPPFPPVRIFNPLSQTFSSTFHTSH